MFMLIDLKVLCLARKCVLIDQNNIKSGDPMEMNLEGFESKTEIYQQIELKEQMKKME